MKSTPKEIYGILNLPIVNGQGLENTIDSIATDSRNISNPESSLFIAIDGNKVSGAEFILQLYEQGVQNFLVAKRHINRFKNLNANVYFVDNPSEALQKIVIFQRNNFHLKTIAITGSNGKTIVKEWLSQILTKEYRICKSPKSYNSQIGVPLSVWGVNESHNLGIFEAGISKPGEMSLLERIIKPEIGILTNIGDAHQANFDSIEQKLQEKLGLFENAKTLITSSKMVEEYKAEFQKLKQRNNQLQIITWGNSSDSDIAIEEISESKTLLVNYKLKEYKIRLNSFDAAFVENCSHCIAAVLCLTGDIQSYISEFEKLSSVEMRLEIIEGIDETTIINDTYNADMESLMIAIQFLFQQSAVSPKVVILSEILETSEQPIQQILNLLQSKEISQLILIGDAYLPAAKLFRELKIDRISLYSSTAEYIKMHDHSSLKAATILIKGARRFKLEDIVKFYRKKTHTTYLKVHLNALKNNLTEFAKCIKPETKIMIMLKAYGYGLGSLELARLFESQRADYFAVAYTDEGIELRNAGIRKPIMVLNPEVSALDLLVDHRLEPEIYSLSLLRTLADALNFKTLEAPVFIHLKVETGMHRLGIVEGDIPEVLDLLSGCLNIRVKSIMSHLAASDDKTLDEFTNSQIEIFERVSHKIEEHLGYSILKHILNTGGIIRHATYQYDMVRLGIGLFGFDTTGIIQPKLQTTISLISKISQIKKLKKGETVGYSRMGKVNRDSNIAIVNIGYADGYFRSFGNGIAQVYVNNQFAPTIGNVCMDMIMIDITDCHQIEEGAEVEILGEHISISQLAEKANTIPYEIITAISNRVQRMYWED